MFTCLLALTFAAAPPADFSPLAVEALAVLRKHCYRCHGQEGAVEGGLNYILDRDKLAARNKLKAVLARTERGRMPPPDVKERPTAGEVAALRRWVEAGAPAVRPRQEPALVSEGQVLEWVLADLEKTDRRGRRFLRYISLVPLSNAGAGPDELRTYRNAVSKLLNSLSWHPKVRVPEPIDAAGLVLRFDLRDYLWDANLWNRLLTGYPYGVVVESGVSRAVLVNTATRMPIVRADWFVATASRAPLYYDLLQIPSSLSELERQLRVDPALNIQQERVARAGFNGSGISRNNRILERHDAMNGAYWRTYDFEAVPQNLIERNLLLPDRRNLFAFPLGPNLGEGGFLHAGGEAIFNLPNGLQAYVLVNANNVRINKGPTDIVSDPKRPDRAVEAGLSCMHCHATGILPKDDQLRAHVHKNRKAFTRRDAETVEALHPPAKKMRALMEEDARRHQAAVEMTGNRAVGAEVVLSMTLRYEADVDLATLAAELGVKPEAVSAVLPATETLSRNLGALKVEGGTVARQVVVQSFADLVRELRVGVTFDPGRGGEALPDATGDSDPLEVISSPANAAAFSPDGRFAALASQDRSVRIIEISTGRDLRRLIGHTASVWCVAFSPDGAKVLSGSKDGSARLWDVETGRELAKLDGHGDLVSAVAFSPDGRRGLSAGYDGDVFLWDLERSAPVAGFHPPVGVRYPHAMAFTPDGNAALVATEGRVIVFSPEGKWPARALGGHAGWVNAVAVTPAGVLTASDDGTTRLWDLKTGKELRRITGHDGPVTSVALSRGGAIVTGGADNTVRLWEDGKPPRVFRRHSAALSGVGFSPGERLTLSASRDAKVETWVIARTPVPPPVMDRPTTPPVGEVKSLRPLETYSVGGTIGSLLVSPDGRWLYVHDRNGRLLKLDAGTMRRSAVLTLEADAVFRGEGELFALAGGSLNTIDPKTMTVKARRAAPRGYDLATWRGQVYVSEDADEWAAVKELVGGRSFGPVWRRSFLGLTSDGRRLCVSSQGVVPGTFELFDTTGRGEPSVKAAADKLPLGGEFTLTPDDRFAVLRTGAVVRLDPPQGVAKVEPHLAVAFGARSAWLLTGDGSLAEYEWPAWKSRGRWRLELTGYRLALDEKRGRVYVAGFDPRAMLESPRARSHGSVQTYQVPTTGR